MKVYKSLFYHLFSSFSKIGRARIDSEAPDTITTWNAEAIALSKTTGLGISSRLAQLTVAKSFFASLELPFSINFGETVTLTPLLFFFSTDRSNITVCSYGITTEPIEEVLY